MIMCLYNTLCYVAASYTCMHQTLNCVGIAPQPSMTMYKVLAKICTMIDRSEGISQPAYWETLSPLAPFVDLALPQYY